MKKILRSLTLITLSLLLSSCLLPNEKGKVTLSLSSSDQAARDAGKGSDSSVTVSNVELINDQIVVTGSDLSTVTKVKVSQAGTESILSIISQTTSQLILSSSSKVGLALNTLMYLTLENAYGASVVEVTFNLPDSSVSTDKIGDEQVTTAKIADGAITAVKLNQMSASVGQLLRWNGTSWAATDLDALTYAGTWDASVGGNPNPAAVGGEYYIVSADGTADPGDGNTRTWAQGDWIVFNDNTSTWDQISNSSDVTSFEGRTGGVTAQAGDYTWAMIDKTTSSIGDIADVDLSTPATTGKVLKFDGTNWVADDDLSGGGAGSVSSSEIADGSIVDADVSGSAAIAWSKINKTGAVASDVGLGNVDNIQQMPLSYLDTTVTLGSDDAKVPSQNAVKTYVDNQVASSVTSITGGAGLTDGPYTTTGTIDVQVDNSTIEVSADALRLKDGGITNAKVNASAAIAWSKIDKTGAAKSDLGLANVDNIQQMPLSYLDTNTSLGSDNAKVASQGAIKTYVDAQVSGVNESQWTTSGSDIYYNSGNVGIGNVNPSAKLDIVVGPTDNDSQSPMIATKYMKMTNTTLNFGTAVVGISDVKVNSGVSNPGGAIGGRFTGIRSNIYTGDSGTLESLYGGSFNYGHGTSSGSGPTTSNAYGLHVQSYLGLGTITNMYGLYLASDSITGGSATNRWGIYQEEDSDNYFAGNIGIGTTSPSSALEVKGNLSTSISGTVDVTSGTNAVVGTGTSFDTELSVGDAIKIGSEIFTVSAIADASNLTLDSNHSAGASGVTATSDPTLFSLKNGDNAQLLNVDNSGLMTLNGILSLQESSGSDSIDIRSPASISGSYVLTLPDDDGDSGEVLTTDGSGVLSWAPADAATSVSAGAGAVGTPSMSFSSDSNTGFYSSGADQIGISSNGVNTFNFTTSALTSSTTGGATLTTANGTAAAPTFSFAGDEDTGWFRPTTNEMAAATGGSERIRIDSSGNVGIGTTSPGGKFNVYRVSSEMSAGVATIKANHYDNPASGLVVPGFSLVTGTSSPLVNGYMSVEQQFTGSARNSPASYLVTRQNAANAQEWWGTQAVADDRYRFIYSASASGIGPSASPTEIMSLTKGGSVGIGTTNPGNKLEIEGSSATAFSMYRTTNTVAQDVGMNFKLQDSASNKTTYASISGEVTDNTDGAEEGSFVVQTVTAGSLTEKMRIDNLGNVGIGTTNPDRKLDIVTSSNEVAIETTDGVVTTRIQNGSSGGLIAGHIGTASNHPLAFYTNSTAPKMTIDNTGNVGIGTTVPERILHLKGSPGSSGLLLLERENNTTDRVDMVFEPVGVLSDGNRRWVAGITENENTFRIGSYDGTTLTRNINLDKDGNVGIGTTDPNQSLHIKTSNTDVLRLETSATDEGSSMIFSGTYGWGSVKNVPFAKIEGRNLYSSSMNPHGELNFYVNSYQAGDGWKTREKMTIKDTGNVGIGTTSPSQKLHVVGNLRVEGSSDCLLGNSSGAVSCTSDSRLKDQVKPISHALDKIKSVKGVDFVWNNLARSPGRHDIGVIAQDIQKAFPTAVIENDEGYLSVDYAVLVAPLIESVKELDENMRMFKTMQDGILNDHSRKIATLESLNRELREDYLEIKSENELIKEQLQEMKAFLCMKNNHSNFCKR